MAKKRKKSTTGKRRKVSGVKDLDIQQAGLALAGAIGTAKLSSYLASKPGFMGKVAPWAGLILGIGLPMVVKNKTVKDLALGMLVGGGLSAIKQIAPTFIAGPYQIPVVSGARRRVNGGVMNPGAVGNGGYSPARNSVNDTLSVINGMPSGVNGSAMGY